MPGTEPGQKTEGIALAEGEAKTEYQVLARKYRPQTFADLRGQEAMVRTLKNAFASDRIAHAFILTGLRGIGKTTTARIVAKGLNCVGPDGNGGPTIEPCGVCDACRSIAEGNHVDVMEMDAASRTGVNDIREIIDSVNYRAASARYKVYIIDEVHMLSVNAFNALLKTLEEPPEHVKFIFATTEIRKVPVTVLSRCQRFDLKRFEPEVMLEFLREIADKEGASINDDALALITRAAEGSARDALSLLDQAIAHGAGETGAEEVRAMLGLADRGRVLDLFEAVMKGEAGKALGELASQYSDGADPLAVLSDLAEVTHWVSVVKISPEAADDPTVSPDERARGLALSAASPMRALTRMWQMLLKALEEVAHAPNAMMAAEMVIIRLTHVSDLPTPGDLVAKLKDMPAGAPQGGPIPGGGGNGGGGGGGGAGPQARGALEVVSRTEVAPQAAVEPAVGALARFETFEDVLALIRRNRDIRLLVEVEGGVKLAQYSPGRIEFQPAPGAAADLAGRLSRSLHTWTGVRWAVSVVSSGGAQTVAELRDAELQDRLGTAKEHPLVQAALEAFPGAQLTEVRAPEEFETGDTREVDGEIVGADDEVTDDENWVPVDPFEGE